MGILLHIHFCQILLFTGRNTGPTGEHVHRKTTHTHTQWKGMGCASFMDTFNVEVTVTLMLNMLDEVTNTVQLIKFDYAGKKKKET